MSKVSKKKKLKVLTSWMSKFPCNEYFGKNHPNCIMAWVHEEEMMEFIDKECDEGEKSLEVIYRKGDKNA